MMMVMTTKFSNTQLEKEEREKQNSIELRVLILVIKTP